MGDPLSVSASVFAVAGTAISVVKAIRTVIDCYKDAPTEISALSDVLQDFIKVLQKLKDGQIGMPSNPELKVIIDRADTKISALDVFVKSIVLHAIAGPRRSYGRLKWTKEKEKAQEFTKSLQDIKLNLSLLLDENTRSSNVAQLQISEDKHHDEISAHLDRQSTQIGMTVQLQATNHAAISTHMSQLFQDTMQVQEAQHNTTNAQLANISDGVMMVGQVGDRHHNELLDICKNQLQTAQNNEALIRGVLDLVQRSHRSQDASRSLYDIQSLESSSLGIKMRRRAIKTRVCSSVCPCRCHKQRRFRSPQFLDRFMGALSVRYSGLPLLSCDKSECWSRTSMSATTTYIFPKWYLSRALFMAVTGSLEPSFSLKMPRIVSGTSPSFAHVRWNQLDSLRRMFEEGSASPSDVNQYGQSLLYAALMTTISLHPRSDGMESCKLLLDWGADPEFINDTPRFYDFVSMSANDAANLIYLGHGCNPANYSNLWGKARFSEIDLLQATFHISPREFIIEQDFPRLHRAVFQGSPQILARELKASSSDINKLDVFERSASYWAAIRLDICCFELLLQYGAKDLLALWVLSDMECNTNGEIEDRNRCVELILGYGEAHFGTNYLEVVDYYGNTPLMNAIRLDLDLVRLLLNAGANIHPYNHYGDSPLSFAVCASGRDMAEVLLDYGLGDLDFTRQNFWTVFVQARILAEEDIMEILISAEFRVFGLSAQDWIALEAPLGDGPYLSEEENILRRPLWVRFIAELKQRMGYDRPARIEELSDSEANYEDSKSNHRKNSKGRQVSDDSGSSEGSIDIDADDSEEEQFEDAVEFS